MFSNNFKGIIPYIVFSILKFSTSTSIFLLQWLCWVLATNMDKMTEKKVIEDKFLFTHIQYSNLTVEDLFDTTF